MDGGEDLEHTPTWAVSIFCLFFFLLSYTIDTGLHHLAKFLRKRKRKSLDKALVKIKTEMMNFGFISLLLAILEVPISKICVTEAAANSFLPCKDAVDSVHPTFSSAKQVPGSNSSETLSNQITDDNYCQAKGMVSLVSREAILQLNIFISVLAVFHVLYCILTMCLGVAKMRKWEAWEEETQTIQYQIANDPKRFQLSRQTSFGRRHLKLWSDHPLLLWPVCFARQFSSSVSKADYFTLRNGFIMANVAEGSNFNFKKFLSRTFDDDFEQVVGIRFWIWIFSILFIFFSAHEFYNHYWLPFVPLVIVLVVGTKLEVTITKMCVESCKENPVTQGTFLVNPSDSYFWFGRPDWLLHLLQLILIQNSFQLAFFTWTWYEYGLRSCFNENMEDFTIRITMGVAVQLLCGYVTLPLYALVTQMGSSMKRAVYTECVVRGLENWQKNARHRLSTNRSNSSRHSSNSSQFNATETSISNTQSKHRPEHNDLPPLAVISPSSYSPGNTEEEVQHGQTPNPAITSLSTQEIMKEEANCTIITTGTYDGEISFGSSWKARESSRGIGEITSITEEDASDTLTVFNH
ncbi:MLO-like protein 12 [Juglans microcarpa x Juglans regia]|uniref:MLO-like protein 12 n=1 Tax=Juglans microcarpa x Juglans regia TaxID=2249226 RepID=UPI001B7DE8BC|nr:MLO-like protein 12 [Juglans microcarpa x Juglans regia]